MGETGRSRTSIFVAGMLTGYGVPWVPIALYEAASRHWSAAAYSGTGALFMFVAALAYWRVSGQRG